ncbi:MAG TPA: FKBP-type peptidyl-prolyl cis-trans isomerase [Steroidobacteraceae bacterium]|nr:FKBP-type peptidyl-prolyl cis-trans isomerase [Steroidobacteraceae bacterium]
MKPTTRQMIARACASALLISIAPFAGAQNTPRPPAGAGPGAPPPPAPALSNDQASYLFGLTLGESLHGLGLGTEVLPDAVERGVKDAMAGKKSTPDERQQLQQYARTAMIASANRNKSAAEEFLAKNGKEKGVKTTASGLEYKILKAGDPKVPLIEPTDEVTVNYRGKLIDGTEFDSSYAHGQPATFPANGVIKGWQEALVMMKPGASWELFIPPELAYGPSPRPGIPANSLLIFTVDVLNAKPRAAPAARPAPPPPPAQH